MFSSSSSYSVADDDDDVDGVRISRRSLSPSLLVHDTRRTGDAKGHDEPRSGHFSFNRLGMGCGEMVVGQVECCRDGPLFFLGDGDSSPSFRDGGITLHAWRLNR